MYKEVISFWFVQNGHKQWFKKNRNFDNLIEQRFRGLYNKSTEKKLFDWEQSTLSCLALIIILDQFSRNLFRHSAKAFDQDYKALTLCKLSLEKKYLKDYNLDLRMFALLPLVHSKNLDDHLLAEGLCEEFLGLHPNYDYIKKSWDDHKLVIKKFGRYPHRCAVLGLKTSEEERLFLMRPNTSW